MNGQMGGGTNKRYVGGGLRLAAGSAAPLRLDHGYFEDEVRPMLGAILLKKGWMTHDKLDAALEAARRMFAVPVRFADSGAVEVAIGDPADADVDALEQILGRRVELVIGERSVIQDSWRYMR